MQAKVTHAEDGVLRIDGHLTFNSVRSIFQESLNFLNKLEEIHIDLSQVTHSDSAGLALLTEWQRLAQEKKKRIYFENLPDQLLNLARVSKVDALLAIDVGE